VFALVATTTKAASIQANDGASVARTVDSADRAEIFVHADLKTKFREIIVIEDSPWIHAFAAHLANGSPKANQVGTVVGFPQIEFFAKGRRLISFTRVGDDEWWAADQSGGVLALPKSDCDALTSMLDDARAKS
jgi:hypothetical protein